MLVSAFSIKPVLPAMPCHAVSILKMSVRLHNENQIMIFVIMSANHCIHPDRPFLLLLCCCLFCTEWSENANIKPRFPVSLTDCCELLCSDTSTQSGLPYWCSYNLDTLQGLMSILTRLLLWPHFLLLGDGDGSRPHADASWDWTANACVCVWERKGVSVCLNVASKLTSHPLPAVSKSEWNRQV